MSRSSKRRTKSDRRSRFTQINASWAIEGQIVDEADLAMQERIIRGEITAEEAIDELKDRYAIR
ncbi:MAG TPA: antitoxin VbhA family protein [Steroidobacteraceae bacterium]|nr:antitoxin VbhA family protein [Steroidobacteraceae bacterium]